MYSSISASFEFSNLSSSSTSSEEVWVGGDSAQEDSAASRMTQIILTVEFCRPSFSIASFAAR